MDIFKMEVVGVGFIICVAMVHVLKMYDFTSFAITFIILSFSIMAFSRFYKRIKLMRFFKYFIMIVSIFIIPTIGFSQKKDFQGEITYRQTMHSKMDNVSDKRMQSYFGDKILVTIKNGNYKQQYLNSKGITNVIYISALNKWFYKIKDIDTLYFKDGSVDTSKVLSLQKDTLMEPVLGFQCKTLTMQTADLKVEYFYADSLHMNPDNFTQHVFLHYNLYAMESKAIYLKLLSETKLFNSELIAIDIADKEVDDDEFNLPSLPQIQK